jgi:hypothetical protein
LLIGTITLSRQMTAIGPLRRFISSSEWQVSALPRRWRVCRDRTGIHLFDQIMPNPPRGREALPAVDQTMRHIPALGIMAQFVADGPVPVHWLDIGRGRRHPYEIFAGDVEGFIAADADIGAGCADQRLRLGQD